MSARARDVLAYLNWWDYMLWREQNATDPAVEWQRDLSWDEIAAMVGVDAPRLAPGDLAAGEDVSIGLYWPGPVPTAEQSPAHWACPHCGKRYPDEGGKAEDRGGDEPWCSHGYGAGVFLRRPGSPLSSWRIKMRPMLSGRQSDVNFPHSSQPDHPQTPVNKGC